MKFQRQSDKFYPNKKTNKQTNKLVQHYSLSRSSHDRTIDPVLHSYRAGSYFCVDRKIYLCLPSLNPIKCKRQSSEINEFQRTREQANPQPNKLPHAIPLRELTDAIFGEPIWFPTWSPGNLKQQSPDTECTSVDKPQASNHLIRGVIGVENFGRRRVRGLRVLTPVTRTIPSTQEFRLINSVGT